MNIHKTRLFIVDDNKSFGSSLKRLLNVIGVTADYFVSAQAFLDSVPCWQKGIAIVDIHMPECDGFLLMEKMHELCYSMPVILITGQTEAGSRDMAIHKGAVGFLQKPFNEASLVGLIESLENEEGTAANPESWTTEDRNPEP